jgi:hypothetical protein
MPTATPAAPEERRFDWPLGDDLPGDTPLICPRCGLRCELRQAPPVDGKPCCPRCE